ncbi:FMN-binding negative transcriptional regulator [Intrasporangium calvum]|uniref:FMN-binding negative transcriptional regulator n=1 Tax=Intrasporangium calvum (strain ATCC 23552 / DSM 43043 / JCM 3097 / NBRC 12989 / NCIMB 10167 / NRRL B-3866 / 7 KIP) TaxID=710696 RepID=E6SEF8_INTC7|nr:FMN-binding negative transcriptional regulator [Intrasporangium calvum]ADU49835.1 FMN-binding negative transcriptional regulator [Intrasporangium calvum DSM 43043]
MYVPHFNAMDAAAAADFLDAHPAGHLVTVGPDGRPDVTLLPLVVEDGRVLAHLARANEHWRRIAAGSPGVIVVTAADAYVSPGWYPSKAEHGRTVPTWNYSEVQLSGPVTVHDDLEFVRDVVTRLTHRHEDHRAEPWAVTDAPERYVEGQLRAVVGVELRVEAVSAKAKLSQNRSPADRMGAIAGLEAEPGPAAHEVARAMRAVLGD